MTTDQRVIAELAQANPVPPSATPTTQERAEAERILSRVLGEAATAPPRRPQSRLGLLVPVASLLVVVGVAALILRTGGSSTSTGSAPRGGQAITLTAQPTLQTPRVTPGAISREITLMRRRLATLGRGYTVTQSGAHGIVVTVPKGGASLSHVAELISQPARLFFYDWEANVLTPNGKTAASQLLAQDRGAISVSQGGNQGPGAANAGGMPLYDAVTVAAEQPRAPASRFLSRLGPEYYMFGAAGSSACATAARDWGASTTPPGRCLLAGPVSAANRREAIDQLASEVSPGIAASQGQVRVIPQGTVVLQATRPETAGQVPVFSPAARFFVLHDHAALTGNDITHPRAGTDQSGLPDVTFGFTGPGEAAFQRVTKAIAHRGANVSSGATLGQHFAVALDDQLLTVPQIDFHVYPDGVIGGSGADITGGFTHTMARDLATELRYGPLPLAVRVVR